MSAQPAPRSEIADDRSAPIRLRAAGSGVPKIVCVGSSTGGPEALASLVSGLAGTIELPILITQHMPKAFTADLAERLKKASGLDCAEAVDGEPVLRRRVYLAPGDRHMTVARESGAPVIRLVDGAPENFCKPAVDPMLRSVVALYGGDLLVVILTGMGQDGLDGARAVAEAGGTILAQDEDTSVVWGMPGAVATAGICSAVLPIDTIAATAARFIEEQKL